LLILTNWTYPFLSIL